MYSAWASGRPHLEYTLQLQYYIWVCDSVL